MKPRPLPAAKQQRRTPPPESDQDLGRPRFAAVIGDDGQIHVGVAVRPDEARALLEERASESLDDIDEDDDEDEDDEDEDGNEK